MRRKNKNPSCSTPTGTVVGSGETILCPSSGTRNHCWATWMLVHPMMNHPQTEQHSPVISSSAASLTPCRCYFKYWLRGVMFPFWITSRDHQSHEVTLTSLLDRQALKLDRTKVPAAVISYKSWVALADSPRTCRIVCFKPITSLIHKASQGPMHQKEWTQPLWTDHSINPDTGAHTRLTTFSPRCLSCLSFEHMEKHRIIEDNGQNGGNLGPNVMPHTHWT